MVRLQPDMTRPALLLLASWLVFFGCGKKVDSAFFVLKEKAMNDLKAKTASHEAAWGMGKGDRWDFNQDDGKLVFTFPDKTVTCDAQIIGSFNKAKGTWLWSWD
ncbi:MAG TPA: hypothetical protein VHH73_05625, partial [Verrucomicrobiae bacterium]|nr:hypothetical protein [Verrucomicrobiae bacterium]